MGVEPSDEARWEAVEEAAELLGEGQPAEALQALRDVVAADPRNAYGYHLVGLALSQLGQIEPARDAFRAAVRLAPDYLGARLGLSHCLRLLGHLDGALAQAKEALRRFPDSDEALTAAQMAAGEGRPDAEGEVEPSLPAAEAEAPEEPDWGALRALSGGRDD